jgi:aspartate-semialdehyde dehydrogenase
MSRNKLSNPVVAVVGATGAVGVELIQCLEQRKFPLSELRLFASARSAGKSLKFRGKKIKVKELTEESFEGVQIGLFSAGSSTEEVREGRAARHIIVDNSSAYRMDPEVTRRARDQPQMIRRKGIIARSNARRSSRSRRCGRFTRRTGSSG